MTSSVEVNITVKDENDNPPRFLFPDGAEMDQGITANHQLAYFTMVRRDASIAVITLRCMDPDFDDTVKYRLTTRPDSVAFRLNEHTGDLYLDGNWKEITASYMVNVSVTATDGAGNSANATLMVMLPSGSGVSSSLTMGLGLGIGLTAVLVLLAAVLFLTLRRRRRKRNSNGKYQTKADDSQPGFVNIRGNVIKCAFASSYNIQYTVY